jgi:hypothetical protein
MHFSGGGQSFFTGDAQALPEQHSSAVSEEADLRLDTVLWDGVQGVLGVTPPMVLR